MEAISKAVSHKKKETQERRGRDRTLSLSSSNSGRRATRAHSPYRNSEYAWEEERYLPQQQRSMKEMTLSNSSLLTSSSGNSKSLRKWRLRDLLLFRSALEG
ncbi:hypothetical protein K1719_034856 [Acacia pycnantha]|nr:hypothetical protein K1719_034856 [Acacia pycnantha]